MTFRRTILIVLLLVLSLLLIYNSFIAPLFVRSYNQMGMGMHGRMWQAYYNTNNFIDFRIIFFLAVIIAGIFLYDILSPANITRKCKHCGHAIDNDQWKICPMCGSGINQKRGDS